eukprot:TRINITY_DN4876_c0_g1_i1.p1 TRINITY_DN4876_c0_g1~~TRINITY_DN4876_c0_g1_i1.p1  ORF type:complete len:324 (-),score=75.21 TRINITY_DN4876_c0_g1_i1:40-1011(-)
MSSKKRRRSDSSDSDDNRKKKKHKEKHKKSKKITLPLDRKKISTSDYFKLNPEFREWLRTIKDLLFDDLKDKQQKKLFKQFVKRWNSGKLAVKFYQGIGNISTATKRTHHQWNIKHDDPTAVAQVRMSVERYTNKQPGVPTNYNPEQDIDDNINSNNNNNNNKHNDEEVGPKIPPNIGTVIRKTNTNFAEKEEERIEGEEENKRALKFSRKYFNKQQKENAEELIPKPDNPREARIEKRKQTAAFAKAKDDEDEVIDEYANDPNDFKAVLRRRSVLKDRRSQEKRELLNQKLVAQQKKEAQTMALLRQLAAARKWETATKDAV